MSKLLNEQLKQVKLAVSHTNNDGTVIFTAPVTCKQLVEGGVYNVIVANYIVNPPHGFDFHINWNNGTHPNCDHLSIRVLRKLGQMVQVFSMTSDGENWCGWLPEKAIIDIY